MAEWIAHEMAGTGAAQCKLAGWHWCVAGTVVELDGRQCIALLAAVCCVYGETSVRWLASSAHVLHLVSRNAELHLDSVALHN